MFAVCIVHPVSRNIFFYPASPFDNGRQRNEAQKLLSVAVNDPNTVLHCKEGLNRLHNYLVLEVVQGHALLKVKGPRANIAHLLLFWLRIRISWGSPSPA